MRIREYREINYKQCCAIARNLLIAHPAFSDSEWKAAIKDTCEKQGYENPATDLLTRVMSAVEYAVAKTVGPRPLVEAKQAAPQRPEAGPPTAQEWQAMCATLKACLEHSRTIAPVNVVPIALERSPLDEQAIIDVFYAEASTGDRIGALKRFAEIAIERPADWDYEAVRLDAPRQYARLHAETCYGCGNHDHVLNWHHIIQIQHGGSNYIRNFVAICGACHSAVHPWLPKQTRSSSSWASFADMAPAIADMVDRGIKSRRA